MAARRGHVLRERHPTAQACAAGTPQRGSARGNTLLLSIVRARFALTLTTVSLRTCPRLAVNHACVPRLRRVTLLALCSGQTRILCRESADGVAFGVGGHCILPMGCRPVPHPLPPTSDSFVYRSERKVGAGYCGGRTDRLVASAIVWPSHISLGHCSAYGSLASTIPSFHGSRKTAGSVIVAT